MIKGAIFDFDGTLFDSMSVWDNLGERYLCSRGYTPESNLSEKLTAMSLHQSSCYIKKQYGMNESAYEISSGINKLIENAYIYTIMPKKSVQAFLEQLKSRGVLMCIATATDKYMIEAALQRCDMKKYFKDILTCSEVGFGKDNPHIFREALQMLGSDKRKTIVFEDAYHAVVTAANDGFSVVGVYDSHEKQESAVKKASDFYLSNYSDTNEFWKFISDK